VAPTSNKNENYLAHLKGQSLQKKTLKTTSKSTNKQRRKTYSRYTPRTNNAPASMQDKKEQKKQTYKHHIFASTAGVHCTIFSKLCMVIEHVEDHQKGANLF